VGDVINKKGKRAGNKSTPLEIARDKRRLQVVTLLERFKVNPTRARHEVQVKLGMLAELAAEIYALAVFLCDGLLRLRSGFRASNPTVRFLTIAKRLPMKLQMILCNRAMCLAKDSMLPKDSEAALKSLARSLLLSRSK